MSPTRWTVALMVAAALSALWLPVVAAAGLLAAVALVFAVDAWHIRRAPTVARILPVELVRGRPVPFSVTVTAPSGVTVEVRQPQTAEVRFEPSQGPAGLDGTVVALTRGRHVLSAPVTRSTGVLRLAHWVHQHGEPVTVDAHADLPGARRMAAAVRRGTFRDPGTRTGPLGLGTDFETIRDYTPDDDIRRVNWLATERTGRPMVNQYREDTERDLWCLIDTGRLLASPVGDRTRLDVALDAVAAVAAVADAVGDRVGAVVFDGEVRRVIRPRRASAGDLVRSLDDLEPVMVDSNHDAAFGTVAAMKRSLVIVFTDILDDAASAPLLDALPVLVRRHAVLVAGVVDPDLVDAVTDVPETARDLQVASVATALLDERTAVRHRLSRAGAVVVDVDADTLPSACVAAYLRLKSKARL